MILPQKELFIRNFPFTDQCFLSQEEISCHRKLFPLTGKCFAYRKKSPVTGRNLLSVAVKYPPELLCDDIIHHNIYPCNLSSNG